MTYNTLVARGEERGAHHKLHSVGVRNIQLVTHFLCSGNLHGFGLVSAGEAVTAGQLHPSAHHTTISILVLLLPTVV